MGIKIKTRVQKDGTTRYLGLYDTPDGRRLSAGTFGSRDVARKRAIAAEIEAQKSSWIDPRLGKETLGTFVERVYLETITTLEASTQDNIRSVLKNWILPEFGRKALADIKPSDVQKWVAKIDAKRAPSSVAKYHAVLHKIFVWVTLDGVRDSNPCEHTKLPTVPELEVKILEPEQFDAMLGHIEGEKERNTLLAALGTGMRWSELMGLCPAQIDFPRRRVKIDRAMVAVSKKNHGVRWISKDYPKGKRSRIVPLDDETLNALSVEVARRGLDATSEERIFVTSTGEPLDARNFNQRVVAPALKAAKVEQHVTVKHLRSSYCSWLLAGGAPPIEVQQMMGHKSISTTQRYMAVLPEAEDRARNALQNIRKRSA